LSKVLTLCAAIEGAIAMFGLTEVAFLGYVWDLIPMTLGLVFAAMFVVLSD